MIQSPADIWLKINANAGKRAVPKIKYDEAIENALNFF
ncbi:hypothetical protein J2128_000279 [Methanomicrobium sp. W14]|nr:hypothetical protein [Methanomicrobium sp. W14]